MATGSGAGLVQVTMPMLGLTMEEGTVAQWLKAEGDVVARDEPLLLVEIDKGMVEVPAPASGVLRRIVVQPGQTAPVKAVIAEIGEPGELASPSPQPIFVSPRARMRARELGVDVARISGTGPRGRVVEEDVLLAASTAADIQEVEPPARILATPLARRLALEHGILLSEVQGSGPAGRITHEDVLAAAERRLATQVMGRGSPIAETDWAQVPATDAEGIQPLSRVRRITAERMAQSARSVARVTLYLEADFTEAARFRQQLAPEFEKLGVPKLPWDALIAKAAGLALVEHPAVNATWIEGQGIRPNPHAHVGIAVALEPEGLVVPVVRDAHVRSLRELAADLLALVDKARANRLSPAEMEGGTFTITNLGAYRIDGFTPIINPPQTAILGVGRIAEKAFAVGGRLEPRTACTLSLSFDHRVVDGAPAAAFLARLAELLERPYALLGV